MILWFHPPPGCFLFVCLFGQVRETNKSVEISIYNAIGNSLILIHPFTPENQFTHEKVNGTESHSAVGYPAEDLRKFLIVCTCVFVVLFNHLPTGNVPSKTCLHVMVINWKQVAAWVQKCKGFQTCFPILWATFSSVSFKVKIWHGNIGKHCPPSALQAL